MESLTRLVYESLARHGFDRPVDYRRLNWSSWLRCDSPQSLLQVPSRPGVFALAEEIAETTPSREAARAGLAATSNSRRTLAVTEFYESVDMAFVVDRLLVNKQSPNLASGRHFVRYVVVHDAAQRRSICQELNEWRAATAEKAAGYAAEDVSKESASEAANLTAFFSFEEHRYSVAAEKA